MSVPKAHRTKNNDAGRMMAAIFLIAILLRKNRTVPDSCGKVLLQLSGTIVKERDYVTIWQATMRPPTSRISGSS